jgi:hypothetical protein
MESGCDNSCSKLCFEGDSLEEQLINTHWITTKRGYVPSPRILRKFQSPKRSSIVSWRAPSPISFVLVAAGLMFAQSRSIPSPSVRPAPGRRLSEKRVWHSCLWAGRWNFGMTPERVILESSCNAGGSMACHRVCFFVHWQKMS